MSKPKPPAWSKAMKQAKGKAGSGGKKTSSSGVSSRVQRAATIAARSDSAVRKLPLTGSGNYPDRATMKKGNRLLKSQRTAERALAHYAKQSPSGSGAKRSGTKSKPTKMGKSAKNTAARAKYKAAAGKARDFAKTAAKVAANPKAKAKDKAFWKRSAAGAKSGLTRISNNLSGKRKRK